MNNYILKTENLHKTYRTTAEELEVLKGVNLEIKKGEFVSVIGPSGSGKSTLLHIIGTLDRPTRGKVYLNSVDLYANSDTTLSRIRNNAIGFVFQFHHLLPEFTALENVVLPARIGGRLDSECVKRGKDLLCEVGLEERAEHRPAELSGGERQRVAVARALMNEPEIVLADEPSGNLDRKNSDILRNFMLKLNKEKQVTFLVMTHNEDLASTADRKFCLVDGRVLEIRS